MTAPARKPKTAEPGKGIVASVAQAANDHSAMAPATRPMLDSASVFVRELQSTLRNAEGEIDLLDAIEARADDAHSDALNRLNVKHEAEKQGRDRLRAEYVEIATRCKAALGLVDGTEAQQ